MSILTYVLHKDGEFNKNSLGAVSEAAKLAGFFCQAEDGILDRNVTGVQTCALPICIVLALEAAGVGYISSNDPQNFEHEQCRSEERRVGKECRSRWSTYH